MFILFPKPDKGAADLQVSDAEYVDAVKDFVGDPSVPVELISISKWYVNEIIAEYYADGNMYGAPQPCRRKEAWLIYRIQFVFGRRRAQVATP